LRGGSITGKQSVGSRDSVWILLINFSFFCFSFCYSFVWPNQKCIFPCVYSLTDPDPRYNGICVVHLDNLNVYQVPVPQPYIYAYNV